jgi:aspartate aminotransferase
VLELLEDVPGLSAHKPEGAFYLFVHCGGLIGRRTPQGNEIASEQDVVLYLLEAGVAVVVGAAYGMSPYFRMSIATDMASLEEACHRVRGAVAALH